MKIHRNNTISFLTAYLIGVIACEIILVRHSHSFGLAGFLLLADVGMLLSILWGYVTND